MPARRHGFTSTVLMLVPMLAVPAMAIFGIPQFAAVVASQSPSPSDAELSQFRETRIGFSASGPQRPMDLPKSEALDLFRSYEAGASTSSPIPAEDAALQRRRATWSDPLALAEPQVIKPAPNSVADSALPERTVSSSRNLHEQVFDIFADDRTVPTQQTAGATETTPLHVTAAPSVVPEQKHVTWRQAVDRLNALGANTYRLTPGFRPDDFRFVCLVASPDDLRIARRFEAEAPDPLVAVEKVLAQVEQWRRTP